MNLSFKHISPSQVVYKCHRITNNLAVNMQIKLGKKYFQNLVRTSTVFWV